MIFGATTFLYLLPLASLPILFHLILKQKKRTIVFSTLMFFHRVDPKLNTRRQIREWLLLALRVLMIALLLLALSRPTLRSAVGRGGKLSLVAIIDNSGSMSAGANEGDLTKLECAKEGARRLLSALEPDAEAALVLLVEDPMVAVPELLSADRTGLLQCLEGISPTEASGAAPRALARAFELLHQSAAGGGVVHVFTDLQQVEWAEAIRGPEARGDRIHVYLHKIGSSPLARGNVAVTGVQLPDQRILIGQPYEVGLSLRNHSDAPVDIRLNCINGQGAKSTQNLSLEKQEAVTARLPITINEPGYHWLKAWIEGDGFAADNAAGIGLFCEGMATVLFIGEPRQFGALPMALSPWGGGQLTGLATKFSPSLPFGPEDPPILIVTTWTGLLTGGAHPTGLPKYIEEGGSLLVIPSLSPGSDASAIRSPTWLGAGLRPREVYGSGVRLAILSREARFWRQMEQVVGDVTTEPVAAYAFCPLDLPADFTPLLGAGAKKVILAHKTLGKGNIFVSGLAFSPRWSTLPLSALGVVLAQRMAVAGASAQDSHVLPLIAGERPQAWQGEGETELLSLSGDALRWKGRPTEMPPLARTGVYLATTGDQKRCLSVRASPKEGDYRFAESATVPVLGPISHTVVPFEADANYARYHAGQARVTELYLPLLVLLTLAVVAEGLLGAARVRSSAKRAALPEGEARGMRTLALRVLALGRRT